MRPFAPAPSLRFETIQILSSSTLNILHRRRLRLLQLTILGATVGGPFHHGGYEASLSHVAKMPMVDRTITVVTPATMTSSMAAPLAAAGVRQIHNRQCEGAAYSNETCMDARVMN
jgi:hypothetical protein